jgi:hypothetical protein
MKLKKDVRERMRQALLDFEPTKHLGALKQHVLDICKKNHVAISTFYRHRRSFIDPSDPRCAYMQVRRKRVVANKKPEVAVNYELLADAVAKKVYTLMVASVTIEISRQLKQLGQLTESSAHEKTTFFGRIVKILEGEK